MSTPTPPSSPSLSPPSPSSSRTDQHPAFDFAAWHPARRTWLWVLLAFIGGLLLFALVLSGGRESDLDGVGQTPPTSTGRDYAPLPAPLPAGRGDGASGMGEPGRERTPAEPRERPRLVETAPPPPPPTMPVAPAPPPPPPLPTASQPMPIPGQMPAPRYPSRSLRRGESGTVMVHAEIGPDGVPLSVRVASSSGSRALDRAATGAVSRWRFRPATLSDGSPTVGSVLIPIDFSPN